MSSYASANRQPHGRLPIAATPTFWSRFRILLAWFAGVDLRVLAEIPSEQGFYSTLGTVVLLLDCASGFAVCIAVGYMVQQPPSHVWWIGLAWTIILACGIERLMLRVTSTGRLRSLIAALALRVLLSLMLAAVFAEPAMLRIFQGPINGQLSKTQSAAIQGAVNKDATFYGGKINSDYAQIGAIQTHEQALRAAAAHNTFISTCERSLTSCSITHHLGCGPYCEHYARLAANETAELRAITPVDAARIAALRADINRLQTLETDENKSRPEAIAQSAGLLGREEALQQLAKGHPIVTEETWFLRLFFVCLDLLPLGAKVTRMLTVKDGGPYELRCAAARRTDCLPAKQQDKDADLEEKLMDEQHLGDLEVRRTEIRLDTRGRINDAHARAGSTDANADAVHGDEGPISAWSLAELATNAKPWESQPVPVAPMLRRGGLVGTALVAATALVAGVLSLLTHAVLAGMPEVLVVLGLVLVLAAYTRGFSRAPAWALWATLATLVVGLALPIAVLVINL
jgi:hypothetical protein